ncbi:uncharacterized protein LOC119458815 [Dermacentor silvarum]|uniref:uncharacterized protein LOC119458815 n=1 Tax=Dermacentor silvarum TaxID=543639 RepID=UPI002100CF8E|nr:uncharacterized protein LOC119458815 [Dermacentor silvarum]
MSVVPERINEFFEPPKPQEGTILPRYGVENGYLVLEDFKTRDLPRPPPAGWESAKRLGAMAAAALVVFLVVLSAAVVVHILLPANDDSKNHDPPLVANGTNETMASAKLQIDTDVEGDVQVTGDDGDEGLTSTPATTSERRSLRATSKRRGAQRTLRRRSAKKPTLSKQRRPPARTRSRFPRRNIRETANRGAISTLTSAPKTSPTSSRLAETTPGKDVYDDEATGGDGDDDSSSSSEHDTNAQQHDTNAPSHKAFTDILVFGPPLNESWNERDYLYWRA